MTKTKCSRCKESKEFNAENFPRNKNRIDGIGTICRICKRKIDKKYQRERRKTKGLKGKEYRAYCKKYPEKVKAHRLVHKAIRQGKLKKSPCEVCGKEKVHMHHDNYKKPLQIRFLCPVHHKEIHPFTYIIPSRRLQTA